VSGQAAVPGDAPLEPAHTWAVVVNWNGGRQNLACLRSLLAGGFERERIVFVDNGSVDGSRAEVEAEFPGLLFLDNGANLGFGEGANRGARRAIELGARAVFFANNDITLPAETLAALLEELNASPAVGIVGPRVLWGDGSERVWCAGGMMTWRQNLSTLLGHGRPDAERWRVTRDVDYVAGCALLVRTEALVAGSFFEADYFAYMEDVELCLQVREAGWGVRTVGAVSVYHAPSSATGGGYNPRRKWMQGVNSVHFLRRRGNALRWVRFFVFDVLSLAPLYLIELVRGRSRGVLAKGLGILDGLRGRRVSAEQLEEGGGRLW